MNRSNHENLENLERCVAALRRLGQVFDRQHQGSKQQYHYPIDDKFFGLTEKQKELRQLVFNFGQKELSINDLPYDIPDDKYRQIFKDLGKIGALGITVNKDYGGQGGDLLDLLIIEEELGRAFTGEIPLSFIGHINRCVHPLQRYGTEEQKLRYLPKLCSGELIGSIIISHPIAVKLTPQADYYILNSSDEMMGTLADIFVVYAVTNVSRNEKTAFIVEKSFEGFIFTQNDNILFRNCKVPVANMLGKKNEGSKVSLICSNLDKVILAAKEVGIMQACCDATFKCTSQMKYQDEIGDMYAKLCSARSYLYTVARAYDNGHDILVESCAVSLTCTENAKQLVLNTREILGGMSSMRNELKKWLSHYMKKDNSINLQRKAISELILLQTQLK